MKRDRLQRLAYIAAVRYWGVVGISMAFVGATMISVLRAAWLVERSAMPLKVWRDTAFFISMR